MASLVLGSLFCIILLAFWRGSPDRASVLSWKASHLWGAFNSLGFCYDGFLWLMVPASTEIGSYSSGRVKNNPLGCPRYNLNKTAILCSTSKFPWFIIRTGYGILYYPGPLFFFQAAGMHPFDTCMLMAPPPSSGKTVLRGKLCNNHAATEP